MMTYIGLAYASTLGASQLSTASVSTSIAVEVGHTVRSCQIVDCDSFYFHSAPLTASVIDFYRRWVRPEATDAHYLIVSRAALVFWGLFACIVATATGGWLIFFVLSLSGLPFVLAFALLMLLDALILCWKIEASHSVEIRPDAMIVDGEDVFYAQDIGDNWPQLAHEGR